MDVSPFEAVVVIESLSVDKSDVALAVLGDDLLCTGFDLVGQLRQVGPGLGEWDHVID